MRRHVENVDLEDLRRGRELEGQHAALFKRFRFEAAFFLELAPGRFFDGFAQLNLTAEPVPAPHAETALLHAEKNVGVVADDAQGESLHHTDVS